MARNANVPGCRRVPEWLRRQPCTVSSACASLSPQWLFWGPFGIRGCSSSMSAPRLGVRALPLRSRRLPGDSGPKGVVCSLGIHDGEGDLAVEDPITGEVDHYLRNGP